MNSYKIRYSDELYHHGILGQKWGVRRFQNEDGSLTSEGRKRYTKSDFSVSTKYGEKVNIKLNNQSFIAKGLSKISPSIRKNQDALSDYTIKNEKGNKLGTLQLNRDSANQLNVVWIDIKTVNRGKGYAQAVMDGVIREAKKDGYKQITLEVPGISPDAAHIYEKLGFEYVEKLSDDDDIWGGLMSMKRKL